MIHQFCVPCFCVPNHTNPPLIKRETALDMESTHTCDSVPLKATATDTSLWLDSPPHMKPGDYPDHETSQSVSPLRRVARPLASHFDLNRWEVKLLQPLIQPNIPIERMAETLPVHSYVVLV